jgi:hypothetical protein
MHQNLIVALEDGYWHQRNENWKHEFRLSMDTLDNPDWKITIDLNNPDIINKIFETYKVERAKNNWCCCWIENLKFEGRGGAKNLREILEVFFSWLQEDRIEYNRL